MPTESRKKYRQTLLSSYLTAKRPKNSHPTGEKIDAITAEELDPRGYIAVYSPDGTQVLYYNTSSLIKVAEQKGRFMQPPHFMEPMTSELIEKIEGIEGKSFVFTTELQRLIEEDDEEFVLHAGAEDVMENFYLLTPLDIFVCPVCYDYYLWYHFVPSLSEPDRWNEYFTAGTTPPIDPLDVLQKMRDHLVKDNNEEFSALRCIAFRLPINWKRHTQTYHRDKSTGTAREYRVRDFLCNYYSALNHEKEKKFKKSMLCGKNPTPKQAMTQQRYWGLNAGYNKFRYNRLLEFFSDEEVSKKALPNPFPTDSAAQLCEEENCDSDFIDDEASSGDEYNGPRYSPDFSSESSFSGYESGPRSETPETVNSDSHETEEESDSSRVKNVFGEFKNAYDKRLTSEDILFLEKAKTVDSASTLYNPVSKVRDCSDPTDVIDFERLGEELPETHVRVKQIAPEIPLGQIRSSKLLLDDEDNEDSSIHNNETAKKENCFLRGKMLLDD